MCVFYITDAKLEQNQVAGFLTLVRNMIATSLINQESLVRCNGVAIVGALLQKVIYLFLPEDHHDLLLVDNI